MPVNILEVGLGQFLSQGGITAWNICPLVKGEICPLYLPNRQDNYLTTNYYYLNFEIWALAMLRNLRSLPNIRTAIRICIGKKNLFLWPTYITTAKWDKQLFLVAKARVAFKDKCVWIGVWPVIASLRQARPLCLYKEKKDWNRKQSGGNIQKSPHYDVIDAVLGCRDVITCNKLR